MSKYVEIFPDGKRQILSLEGVRSVWFSDNPMPEKLLSTLVVSYAEGRSEHIVCDNRDEVYETIRAALIGDD